MNIDSNKSKNNLNEKKTTTTKQNFLEMDDESKIYFTF